MTVIPRSNRNRSGVQFKSGQQIGDWVAVTDRELPWHTIGSVVERGSRKGSKGTSVTNLMSAAEVLDATGFDIEVQKYPVQFADNGETIDNVWVTGYDTDEGERVKFGAVTDRYTIVQPRDALSFFDHVVEGIDGAGYSAAWDMREKAQMGVTIHLPHTVVVDPDGANDVTDFHLLGINSFDGSTGISGSLTGTRWFCTNQLAPTIHGAQRRFSLRHTSKVHDRVEQARRMIGLSAEYIEQFDRLANRLFQQRMTDHQFQRFLSRIDTFDPRGLEGVRERRCTAHREAAIEAWRAPQNANVRGTRWGALNVVAEFQEWGRPVRGHDRQRSRAVGTLTSPHVSGAVDRALELLTSMR